MCVAGTRTYCVSEPCFVLIFSPAQREVERLGRTGGEGGRTDGDESPDCLARCFLRVVRIYDDTSKVVLSDMGTLHYEIWHEAHEFVPTAAQV